MPQRPRVHLDGIPLRIVQRGHHREPCFVLATGTTLPSCIGSERTLQVKVVVVIYCGASWPCSRATPGQETSASWKHIIERAVIVTQGPTLAFGDWLREPGGIAPAASFPTLDEAERAHIVKALEQCGWRVSGERGAAKLLDMPATTLESRMKRMGLTRPS